MTSLSEQSRRLQQAASRNAASGVYSAQTARHRAAAAAEMVREAVKAGIRHERRQRLTDHDKVADLALTWLTAANDVQDESALASAIYQICAKQLTGLLNTERFARARAVPRGDNHDEPDRERD